MCKKEKPPLGELTSYLTFRKSYFIEGKKSQIAFMGQKNNAECNRIH